MAAHILKVMLLQSVHTLPLALVIEQVSPTTSGAAESMLRSGADEPHAIASKPDAHVSDNTGFWSTEGDCPLTEPLFRSSHQMERIVFAIGAHVPNSENCLLLEASITNIHNFHGNNSMILLVDNDSPLDVSGCMGAERAGLNVLIKRVAPSRYEMGTWETAHSMLDSTRMRAWEPTHIVLIQHSNLLLRPMDFAKAPCRAFSLTHWPRFHQTPLHKLAYRGLGPRQREACHLQLATCPLYPWASPLATCMGIHCTEPCVQSGPITHQRALEWGLAFDTAAAFEMSEFLRLQDIGLWKCLGESMSRDPPNKDHSTQFERVVGILLAKLGNPTNVCHEVDGHYFTKIHGKTALQKCSDGSLM